MHGCIHFGYNQRLEEAKGKIPEMHLTALRSLVPAMHVFTGLSKEPGRNNSQKPKNIK